LIFEKTLAGQITSVGVVAGANNVEWFTPVSQGAYVNQFGRRARLRKVSASKEIHFLEQTGVSWIFYDEDQTHGELAGQLKSVRDAQGMSLLVEYITNTSQPLGISGSYPPEGPPTHTAGVFYGYNADGRLSNVTYRVNGQDLQRASFTYYPMTLEQPGNLQTATIEERDTEQIWRVVSRRHYRYYMEQTVQETPGGQQEIGFAQGLKYVLNPAAYAQMQAAGLTPETADDTVLAAFADHYFEYASVDGDYRVSLERVRGNAGFETYSFSYQTKAGEITNPNLWKTLTTETRPDGSILEVYTTVAGNTLAEALKVNEGGSWVIKSCQAFRYDGAHRQEKHYHDSAIEDAALLISSLDNLSDPENPIGVRASSGKVEITQYYGGLAKDYVRFRYQQKGKDTASRTMLVAYELTPRIVPNVSDPEVNSDIIFPRTKETRYLAVGSIITLYSQTWHGNTLQVAEETRTLPAVPAAQNGIDATTYQETTRYDLQGRPVWQRSARGVLTYLEYNVVNGALVKRIDDVKTSLMLPGSVPAGWSTPSGLEFGKHRITEFHHDALGRVIRELGPPVRIHLAAKDAATTLIRRVRFTTHNEPDHERRTCLGYALASAVGAPLSYHTLGGVTLMRMNAAGQIIEEIVSSRQSSSGPLTATETFPRENWSRWSRTLRDTWGRATGTRTYFDIPASGEGSAGLHYQETSIQRDAKNREIRLVDATGTIERRVYDALDVVTQIWIGTNDTAATQADPSGGGNPLNNMRRVERRVYDGGSFGSGLLTELRRPVDAVEANDRVTTYTYDDRDRPDTETSFDGVRYLRVTRTYDRQDRLTETQTHRAATLAGPWTLVARHVTALDSWGRNYKEDSYGVDPASGAESGPVTSQRWYDAASNVIKESQAGRTSFTKRYFNGLNRVDASFLCCVPGTAGVPAGNTNSLTNDTVLEQTYFFYNQAGDEVVRVNFRRLDTQSPTLKGSLTWASVDASVPFPRARVTYQAFWPDAIGRVRAVADYGTMGGGLPQGSEHPLGQIYYDLYPQFALIPQRSDLVLLTTTHYAENGDASRTVGPDGVETRWVNDKMGRRIRLYEGLNGDCGCLAEVSTALRSTEYVWHPSGQLERLIQLNTTTGDQTTRWVFGTTLAESGIASNHLLRAKIYPESDDLPSLTNGPDGQYARLEYRYNRQGEVIHHTDADGTVHEYEYDRAGRQTEDRVTTLGPDLDASVRRIQRQYEARGLVSKITSHSAVSGGVIVNEVQRDYSPFGLLVSDWQSHSGAVATSGVSVTPRALYGYTAGTGNKLRRTTVTYPNTTRVLNLEYGAANTIDDHLGRIATLDIAGTNIAAYTYCGADWQVEVNYPAANLELTFKQQTGDPTGDAGDIYTGYDRFGRAIDLRWRVASTNAHLERVQYGFDRADRRQWRRRIGVGTPFPVFPDITVDGEGDRYYRYDALGQVLSEDFGDLNLAQSAVAGIPNAGGRWSYDPTGNIGSAQDVIAMTGTERMVRTYDKGNRITASGDGAEPILTDRAGRITRLRGSGLPNHDLKWDAWGRLVAVIPTGNSIPLGAYAYDGLHRRVKRSTIDGVIWNVFYNDAWKSIEERRASHPTQAAIQYFWGARHRDDLIRRDRAPTAGGALSEVRHVLMDYFSPLAITNGATITERYAFGAFGRRTILNAAGTAVIASSTVAWEFGFHGQFRDSETGLYNYGYRYYAPALGRFLSKDPIMEAGGLNLYRMAGNSAVNKVDLLGLNGLDDFLNRFLPNRDQALDAERKKRMDTNKCIGGAAVLCGNKALEESDCFDSLDKAQQLKSQWDSSKKCCKEGQSGPNGGQAKARVWLLAYNPVNQGGQFPPLRQQDHSVTLPPRRDPITPTVPATGGGYPTRTTTNNFDSGVLSDEGRMRGITPDNQPFDEGLGDWLKKNSSYKEVQYCVTCEGNE
jgi:RHS repeat-associated protein